MKPRPDKVFKLKMNAKVAAYMKKKAVVGLKIPLLFATGDRLWMVEFLGAPTGRADLCTVIGTSGNLLLLHRGMCWQQGKFDDDLSELNLTILPDAYKLIDDSAIPEEETK